MAGEQASTRQRDRWHAASPDGSPVKDSEWTYSVLVHAEGRPCTTSLIGTAALELGPNHSKCSVITFRTFVAPLNVKMTLNVKTPLNVKTNLYARCENYAKCENYLKCEKSTLNVKN